jgi:glycosyltransferase involved in cell wall biosynthesis
MRVLHVTRAYSFLTESFIYDTVTCEAELGAECIVATVKRIEPGGRRLGHVEVLELPSKARPDRLLYRAVDGVRADRAPRLDWATHRPVLKRLAERLKPDVIHAHFMTEGVKVAPVAVELCLPLVVSGYGYDLTRLARFPAWREAYLRLWPVLGGLTTTSQSLVEKAKALGCPSDRIHLIHVGKRLGDYPFRPRTGPLRRMVCVGRLVEKKGHLDAVRAVAGARGRGLPVELRIVGGGPLAPAIEQEAARLGIGDAVTLLGPRPHAEVVAELEAADGFMICSKTAADGDEEATTAVILEAQAAGLQVVATRHAGIPEGIPPGGQHLLSEEGDVEGITNALLALAAMTEEARARLSEDGRAFVAERFELRRETERHLALYRRLVGA